MHNDSLSGDNLLPLVRQVDAACQPFEQAWLAGERPRIEDFIDHTLQGNDSTLLQQFILLDIDFRRRAGESPELGDYRKRFPAIDPEWLKLVLTPDAAPVADSTPQFGRYRVEKQLGEGAFGQVFLAHDEQLDRPVAIKVAHRHRIMRPEDVESFLAEARVLASLDHPHIVPVHDVGRTSDGRYFVVSKYIGGRDLREHLSQNRMPLADAVRLVAAVAEALHHAHKRGLVHRDVKPANILLDAAGKPYVGDFGLALQEVDFGRGAGFAGTPNYMSPEQARGEGHRVDGRSDVFSLGVVFYELITGRRPFRGENPVQLFDQITEVDAKPPRQIDDSIPKEVERICLKCLAKRAADRYTTALDLADDLQHFQTSNDANRTPGSDRSPGLPSTVTAVSPPQALKEILLPTTASEPVAPSSEREAAAVVPKGLRSFDAADSTFFLYLLPGARDRNGLPESIRFWKHLIEETDADKTFSVGLLYGPSGCGKSSLLKAGLIPRLDKSIVPVYVEASIDGTEKRLLKQVRRHCPGLPQELELADTLTALRRGHGTPHGQKVLIVLDQFEQWLHARRGQTTPELLSAIRQCDGERLACLLLVRDDFWMAATLFMEALEVPLEQGKNSAAVDLFDKRHARIVLTAFGRAFGVLCERAGDITSEQQQFIEQAVEGLAEEDKIIPVRLALFAEMVKAKSWAPATLKSVGGIEGVGVTFLEESFEGSGSPPHYRLHRKAAQSVLKALLPDTGTELKGQTQSYSELLKASGYGGKPRDFDAVISILDGDLRLVTPADPDSLGESGPSSGERRYQLTHDYLVPSLRAWLTRKQRESRRGRAELRLIERTDLWSRKRENRHLPAWWEWAVIRVLTRKRDWTAEQRSMMGRAGRYHAARVAVLSVILLLTAMAIREYLSFAKADGLTRNLLSATTSSVPGIVADMEPHRRWVDPKLHIAWEVSTQNRDAKGQLHVSLALLKVDPSQAEYLYGRLLTATPEELLVIRRSLHSRQDEWLGRLWAEMENNSIEPDRRLRAAGALALFVPDDPRWPSFGKLVVTRLVRNISESPQTHADWTQVFKHVVAPLQPALIAAMEYETYWTDAHRRSLLKLYTSLCEERADKLTRIEERLSEDGSLSLNEMARAHARIAANLVALGKADRILNQLKHSPDPTLRSYLIEHIAAVVPNSELLEARLAREEDDSIRRALVLIVGTLEGDRLALVERLALIERLAPYFMKLYETDPDAGVHSAAEWVLRKWGTYLRPHEDRFLGKPAGGKRWYVDGQRHTLAVFRTKANGPDEKFNLGTASPFDYHFAVGTKEVTFEQFHRFRESHPLKSGTPGVDAPVNYVSGHLAAAYCNWLSKKENLAKEEWCYVPVFVAGHYWVGMRETTRFLERTGYRLPTGTEWEFACRAQATTPFAFGNGDEGLIGAYARFQGNSQSNQMRSPVGTYKPNDFGLFDMHGNVIELCEERYSDSTTRPIFLDSQVGRGGAHNHSPKGLRIDATYPIGRSTALESVGFRIARTIR